MRPWGYIPLALGVALGLAADRRLGYDLAIVAVGVGIVSSIPLAADLTNAGIARFAIALPLAVFIPVALSRWLLHDRAIAFPMVTGRRWGAPQMWYLVLVVVVGYLILPFYFIGSGAYLNWPDVRGANMIARLFVGVNGVGIWDELFFVCVVFGLFRKHFAVRVANVLQATIFVSFLWELGYREWGPLLTVPFALIQGWVFTRAKSLTYVVTAHLLFDAVVFAVLVHAHDASLFDVFVTAPAVAP